MYTYTYIHKRRLLTLISNWHYIDDYEVYQKLMFTMMTHTDAANADADTDVYADTITDAVDDYMLCYGHFNS